MYEIVKSFNDTTKLAMKQNKIYVLKKIMFEDVEIYRKLSGIDNKNVVRVYETVRIDDDFYAVMEFVQGITLSEYVKQNGHMDELQVREIIVQICDGLESIHALGIVHRDISPNNIMIDENNNIKIIDFGISRIRKNGKSMDTQILGTQGFAAPEQFGFSQTSVRADIYSIGVLMNYLATGCLPSEKMMKGKLASVVVKCTKMDELDRYNNVSELKCDLTKKSRWIAVLRSIPGFRKDILWHKIVAFFYYLFVFVFMVFPVGKEYILWNEIKWDMTMIFLFVLPVPIIMNQFNWQDKWGFTANKSKGSRILVSLFLAGISAFISLLWL